MKFISLLLYNIITKITRKGVSVVRRRLGFHFHIKYPLDVLC